MGDFYFDENREKALISTVAKNSYNQILQSHL